VLGVPLAVAAALGVIWVGLWALGSAPMDARAGIDMMTTLWWLGVIVLLYPAMLWVWWGDLRDGIKAARDWEAMGPEARAAAIAEAEAAALAARRSGGRGRRGREMSGISFLWLGLATAVFVAANAVLKVYAVEGRGAGAGQRARALLPRQLADGAGDAANGLGLAIALSAVFQLVAISVMAIFVFGERPTGLQLAGMALGVVAVAMIAWPTGGRDETCASRSHRPGRHRRDLVRRRRLDERDLGLRPGRARRDHGHLAEMVPQTMDAGAAALAAAASGGGGVVEGVVRARRSRRSAAWSTTASSPSGARWRALPWGSSLASRWPWPSCGSG
jgi:small multidrug resistance pump